MPEGWGASVTTLWRCLSTERWLASGTGGAWTLKAEHQSVAPVLQIDNSTDHSSVFKRLGSSTITCFIAKAAMHRTWRSKELRCQSNKYQAASEAGELEIFASPRPLSSLLHTLWTRSLRQFEFSKCKKFNGAITAICIELF